ncbi:hypothetical protein LSAT2_029971 [Lamellibrachia satsuma]|nr:hypothetical protein LSAT2_029971 [Lamellibrachia satsuma]
MSTSSSFFNIFHGKNGMKFTFELLVLAAVALSVAGVDWEYDDKFDDCLKQCSERYEVCMKCKGMTKMIEGICKSRLEYCEMFCRLNHSHPVE